MPERRCTFAELEGHTIKKVRVAEVSRDCDKDPMAIFQVYEFELADGSKQYFATDAGDLEGFYATMGPYGRDGDPLPIPKLPDPLPGPSMPWPDGPFIYRDFSENQSAD